MISDTPAIIDLLVGVDRRIPQEGDTQLLVPPTGIVTLGLIKPHVTLASAPDLTNVQKTSFINRFSQVTQGPSAGPTVTSLCVLEKGRWDLYIRLTSAFDFAATLATTGNQSNGVLLVYQNNTPIFLSRPAFIGNIVDAVFVQLLLLANATLQSVNCITVAAQNNVTIVELNAVRII